MPADDRQKEIIEETGVKAQLEMACEDLWWSSESDYPVEVVWQPDVEMHNETISEMMDTWIGEHHLEDKIEKIELNNFFERAIAPRSWHTNEDKVQLRRLQQLKDLLMAELSELQVYRCGEVEVIAYVLGYYLEGGVLSGVRTTIIET